MPVRRSTSARCRSCWTGSRWTAPAGSEPGADYRRATLERVEIAGTGEGMSPHDVVRAVRRALPPEAIATVDAGAHMLVAMPLFEIDEPRRCLISSGLATMGFSLPAAIAASLTTDAPVVCLIGDGGLGMCLAELETAARLGRDLRVVVFDDATLTLIAIKQGAGAGRRRGRPLRRRRLRGGRPRPRPARRDGNRRRRAGGRAGAARPVADVGPDRPVGLRRGARRHPGVSG